MAKAAKTFCKAKFDDNSAADYYLLSSLMKIYDAEAKKGIDDKEIFSILYKARFSKNSKLVREEMDTIYSKYNLTAPKLDSLSRTSLLINRLMLKSGIIEK